MPDPSLLSPTGVAMLESLPPILRNSYDYLAVVHACAREIDLLEAALETVRAQFNPGSADVLLGEWEKIVRLPVGGVVGGTDVPTRRASVIARLRKLLGQSEGLQWVATINEIIGTGWSYQEHDPADGTSPAEGILKITIPYATTSPQWTQAITQIREVTAAHLEIDFESSDVFQLDLSEMDVQNFG